MRACTCIRVATTKLEIAYVLLTTIRTTTTRSILIAVFPPLLSCDRRA